MSRSVACVLNSFKLNAFFLCFFSLFLGFSAIEMLRLFQRVESVNETQSCFFFFFNNIQLFSFLYRFYTEMRIPHFKNYVQDMCKIYTFFHKLLTNKVSNRLLMVCVWTLKDSRLKMKIWKIYCHGNGLYRQKDRHHSKSKGGLNEAYFYNEFYFELVTESKAFLLFLHF